MRGYVQVCVATEISIKNAKNGPNCGMYKLFIPPPYSWTNWFVQTGDLGEVAKGPWGHMQRSQYSIRGGAADSEAVFSIVSNGEPNGRRK